MNPIKLTSQITAALLIAGAVPAFSDPLPQEEAVFEEDFERITNNIGMKGWFQFSSGTGATSSAVPEDGRGVDGSRALVFRFAGTNNKGLESYWLAGLGRGEMGALSGVEPGRLRFSAFMQLPNETRYRKVAIRFVQGGGENPSWSSQHVVEVGPDGEVIGLVLGDGEMKGEFSDGEPVQLHAIIFNHTNFGFNLENEFVIDNVKFGVLPATP